MASGEKAFSPLPGKGQRPETARTGTKPFRAAPRMRYGRSHVDR